MNDFLPSSAEPRGARRVSARLEAVQSPVIPVVAEMIRAHPGTISLGQGVVSYGPPPQAIAGVAEFLKDPENHKYRPVHGIPELLAWIERKLADENGTAIGPSRRIVVTAGGNMAFMTAVLAITDPGDEMILPTPYYFNQEMAVTMANCRSVLAPTDERYQLHLDALAERDRPRVRADHLRHHRDHRRLHRFQPGGDAAGAAEFGLG